MCSVKKGVLRNFVKLTGKHLYQSQRNNSGRLLLLNQVTLDQLSIPENVEILWCLKVVMSHFSRRPSYMGLRALIKTMFHGIKIAEQFAFTHSFPMHPFSTP